MRSVTKTKNTSHGFTLIEVLIAILVLGIGMLGLGAIFPAVIAEQRDSFEVIEGANAASVAEALISNREFIDFALLSEDFGRKNELAGERYAYEWVVPAFGASFPNPSGTAWTSPVPSFVDLTGIATEFAGSETGLWSFNSNGSTINTTIAIADTNRHLAQIPVSARVFPQPYSGKDPKYVWDIALRREPSGDRLQAAIFVRRIDARIRVPKELSLSDMLTGGRFQSPANLPGDPVLPVALDRNNGRIGPDDGFNADMVYAAIQTLEVEIYEEHLDWIIFKDGAGVGIDTSVGYATKIGQKLLDNTGVVRTVVGLPRVDASDPIFGQVTGPNRVVQVDPPFVFRNAGGTNTDDVRPDTNTTNRDFDAKRASWVRQVIFTPRTPVTIRVVTLEESR